MAASRLPKVLIVDHDRAALGRAERALGRSGFSTAKAASNDEAIRWLRHKKADLLVLHMKSADGAGRTLLKRLEAMGRSTPFIVVARRQDKQMAARMLKAGALDYVITDSQFSALLPAIVRTSLEKLKTQNQLARAQAALSESRNQMLLVSEREQKRFGAELHDSLGQQLTTIELRCQSLKQDLPARKTDLHQQMAQICQFLRDAITQTRSMAHGLVPLEFHSAGLGHALEELATRITRVGRLKCSFRSTTQIFVQDARVAGHLFRIAQEAIHNAVKHSQATTVHIDLAQKNGEILLKISDNGTGFTGAPRRSPGIGLQLMQHRSSAIGGKLEINSTPGAGVTITCAVRLKSE